VGSRERSGPAGQGQLAQTKGVDRITVVDWDCSRGHGAGHARGGPAAARGATAEEVVAHAREARAALQMWFAVDTLEYLQRGGRIGAAQAWLGSALKIKPILTLEEQITPVERVRTAGRAFGGWSTT
jgi:DegV family protein with EDD domain